MRERFDSVFRRNLLDLVDEEHEQRKKRDKKQRFKIKKRMGGVYGTLAQKMDKKNKKKQAEIEAQSKKGFLHEDMILL